MRNALPSNEPRSNESLIINLNEKEGPTTNWLAYKKRGSNFTYFDSFGDLGPPEEMKRYFRGYDITYNYKRIQKFNTVWCGHFCQKFLLQQDNV